MSEEKDNTISRGLHPSVFSITIFEREKKGGYWNPDVQRAVWKGYLS